ncbi:MAG: hypothetical protein JSV51_08625 [Candidatus Bathyarchaeota archaeon]|nr:MAG: hypothetical protein JSV51_08625 [Candidatus Bathyarchaeota archaeon]
MSKVKGCAKCGGKMIKSSEQTLGDVFGCTRRESGKPERVALVQPYYCKDCGFIELYKEL